MNGTAYTYGAKPHAVTVVGSNNYVYDANGNMTSKSGQNLTWDYENRPVVVAGETYVYDGDGNRISKTVSGATTLYINKYYEKNTSTGIETTSYYLGDKLIATRAGDTLTYIHQDSLGSTSTVSSSTGALVSSIRYYPFGGTRSGSVDTDKKFTGQRLDGTGLYYYNARYYDPAIGRFVSPDSVGQKLSAPQTLNRYSYVQNNPLKYTDPTGHFALKSFLTKVVKVALVVTAVVAVTALAVVTMGSAIPVLAAAAAGAVVNTGVYAGVTAASGGNITAQGLGLAAFSGAVTGIVMCASAGALGGVTMVSGGIGGGVSSAINMEATSALTGQTPSNQQIAGNLALGVGMGIISGGIIGAATGPVGRDFYYPNGALFGKTEVPLTFAQTVAIETTLEVPFSTGDQFWDNWWNNQ